MSSPPVDLCGCKKEKEHESPFEERSILLVL